MMGFEQLNYKSDNPKATNCEFGSNFLGRHNRKGSLGLGLTFRYMIGTKGDWVLFDGEAAAWTWRY